MLTITPVIGENQVEEKTLEYLFVVDSEANITMDLNLPEGGLKKLADDIYSLLKEPQK